MMQRHGIGVVLSELQGCSRLAKVRQLRWHVGPSVTGQISSEELDILAQPL